MDGGFHLLKKLFDVIADSGPARIFELLEYPTELTGGKQCLNNRNNVAFYFITIKSYLTRHSKYP